MIGLKNALGTKMGGQNFEYNIAFDRKNYHRFTIRIQFLRIGKKSWKKCF